MRVIFIHIVLVTLLVISTLSGISQKLNGSYESVTFVSDRDLYLSGEDLWFAGKVKSDGSPSKVVYVEVFNNESNAVSRAKYWVIDGIFSGNINLPEFLETGYYQIRIYTHFQKNFPVWQMSSKIIKVVNTTIPLPKAELDINKEAFSLNPEGKLCFMLNDLSNESELMLLNGSEVLDSSVVFYPNGLGIIDKKYLDNDNLELKIYFNGEEIRSVPVIVPVRKTSVNYKMYEGTLVLRILVPGKNNGELLTTATNIKSGSVYNSKGRILEGKANVEFEGLEQGLYIFDIKVDGKNIMSFVDLIITDNDKLKGEIVIETATIYGTTDQLRSQLPDYIINNPLHLCDFGIINNLNKELVSQAHILLSLKSEEIIEKFGTYEPENVLYEKENLGPIITGYIQDTDNVDNVIIYCSYVIEASQFFVTRTNKKGNFTIQLGNFDNNGDVYLTSEEELGELKIRSNYCSKAPIWNPVLYLPDSTDRELLTELYINSQFSSVFNNEQAFHIDHGNCFLPLFAGNMTTYRMSNYIQMATTQELINEIVSYVRVKKITDGYQFLVLDDKTRVQYSDPLVMLDNIYYPDISEIMKLQPSEITHIDVISRKYFYGDVVFNGVVRVNTTSGIREDRELPGNGVFFKYSAPEKFTEFRTKIEELSNTLYWNIKKTEETGNNISISRKWEKRRIRLY